MTLPHPPKDGQDIEYARILEIANDGFWVVDSHGNILAANEAMARLLGYSVEELCTMGIGDVEAVESLQEVQARTDEIKARGSLRFETLHRRKDGSLVNVEVSTSYLPGAEERLVAFVRDISERKRIYEAILESQERFRMLFDNISSGVAIYEAVDGGEDFVFVDINSAGEKLSQIHREDVVGKRVTEVFPGIREMGLLDVFRSVHETGETRFHPLTLYHDGRMGQWVENQVSRLPSGLLVAMYEDTTEKHLNDQALRDSEERFRELAELLPEAVFETDTSLTLTYANQKAFDLFGYTQEGFEGGLQALDMLESKDRNRALSSYKTRLKGVDPGVTEYTAVRRDETRFPILFHASVIRRDGEMVGLRGIIVDLTERKRAEREMEASSQRFKNIVESSPMGMHLYELRDNDRLVLVGANPAADQILGVDHDVFLGMTIEEAFPAVGDSEIPRRYRDAAARGIEWRTDQITCEAGAVHGAFEVVAFQTSPGRMASMFRDVTVRKQAEEAVKASEARFRSVVDQSNEAIYILYEDRFDLVNRKFSEMTGVSPEEAASPDFDLWQLVADESKPLVRERQAKRARGETVPDIYDFEIVPRTGPKVHVEASVTEIAYGDGKAVLGRLRDVTEQKRLETQLHQAQKMESIGRLSGGVAHDLNNLLTPIIGYAELLRDDLGPEDHRRESAEEVIRAGFRARDLVRQLLAFSRRQTLEFKPTDLNALILGFEKLLRRTIREDIEIRVRPGDSVPTILGDKGQLEQVIMNLAVNAQDAMPHGGTLHIETASAVFDEEFASSRPGVTPGDYVLLALTDDGEGIDALTRERIFEPFFTTKEKGRGTGLGLSTVYGIVKQHGGNIWVYSEPGEGTTFKCYFPVASETPHQEESRAGLEEGLGGAETIVVVEDEESVRSLAVSILTRSGYTVKAARDAHECLTLLDGGPGSLDLLLTDVVLPGMNGRELFEEVSRRFPGTRGLFMSGYTDDVVSHRGVLDEGVAFLHKPFSVQSLIRKVREVLDDE